MDFLKLAFIYKNHDTLRYVTLSYTKIQTLRKKHSNLHYVFIYKNPDTLCYVFFMEFLKLAERGGRLFEKNNALCVTFLVAKNNALSVTLLYTKIQKLYVAFLYAKNNAIFVTFLYLNFIG